MFLAYRFLLFLRCFTFCSQARHGSWLWHGSSSTAVSGQFPPCGTVCIIKRHDATYWGQSHHISLGCTTFCWRGAVDRSQRAQRDCGKSLGSPTSFVGFQCADHGLRSMSQVWKLLRIHLSEFVVQRQCLVPVCVNYLLLLPLHFMRSTENASGDEKTLYSPAEKELLTSKRRVHDTSVLNFLSVRRTSALER